MLELTAVHRLVFALTVALEAVAAVRALRCRAAFAPDDLGRRTWSLFSAFLIVRLVAELRLATIYAGIVPDGEAWRLVYIIGLRYLYTLADVLAVIGLAGMIGSLRGLGLQFSLRARDKLAISLVALLPLVAFAMNEQLSGFVAAGDRGAIAVYRMIAATISAVFAMLCIVILRYTLQMGGGALARVWGAVVLAGLLRAGSFVALALVGAASPAWAELAEQLFLLGFALAWLAATRATTELQRRRT